MMGLSVFRAGFTPAPGVPEYDPPSTNRVLWLSPHDETTLDSPTGMTYVVDDKSGAGNHLTAQTGKPIGLRANPLRPARRIMKIEGGASGVGGFARLNGLASTLNGSAWTLIFVAAGTFGGSKTIFAAGNSGTTTPVIQLSNISGKWRLFLRNSGTYNQSSTASNDAMPHVFTIRLSGTRAILRVDGVQQCDAAWTEANNVNRVLFGGLERTTITDCGDVLLGTVLCYSASLSDVDVAAIEAALIAQELPALSSAVSKPSQILALPKLARPTLSGGIYGSSYSTAFHYDDSALTRYYVDPVSGNNAAAGTAGAPLKDLNTALAKSDVSCVILAAGIYTQDEPWTTYTRPNRSVIVRCPSGRAVFGKFETATWALTAAQTFTYQHTIVGTLSRMHDAAVRDADGLPTVLTSRASIALVEANPGSYYNNAGTLYVHTADSRPADRSVLVELTGATAPQLPFNAAGFFLTLQNCDFIGTAPPVTLSGCNFYLDGVRTNYAPESSSTDADEIYRYNCVSANVTGTGDIWDYRGDVLVLEQGCIARNAGTGDAANCSTLHGTAVALRINSDYSGGRRTIHDVETAMAWNLGCDASDSVTGGANTDLGWTCGDIGVSSTTQVWLDGCTASGNTVDIFTGVNATTRYRNMTIGDFTTTTESGGTLTTY